MRVLDADDAFVLDSADAPRRAAEQEDVAGCGFDRKVFVDRSHVSAFGLLDDSVVAGLGNRAAVDNGGQTSGAARAHDAVDAVAVDQWVGASAAFSDSGREHVECLIEGRSLELSIGCGAAHDVEEFVLEPLFFRCRLCDDLLGQDFDWRCRLADAIEAAALDGADHRRALDQFVERRGEERAMRDQSQRMPGASDALQEGGNAARRPDLADEVDRADIDAQFERGGGDDGLEVAGLEPLLHRVAAILGEGAVMARDVLLAESNAQLVRHALGQRATVDEDQRRPMLHDQLSQTVVHRAPVLVCGERRQRRLGRFNPQGQLASMAQVEDAAGQRTSDRVHAGQECGDLLHRLLGGREADSGRPAVGDVVQSGQR